MGTGGPTPRVHRGLKSPLEEGEGTPASWGHPAWARDREQVPPAPSGFPRAEEPESESRTQQGPPAPPAPPAAHPGHG